MPGVPQPGARPRRDGKHQARRRIRREFAFAPDDLFTQGRIAFIHRMLDKDAIFATPLFRRGHEEAARENLQRELDELERGVVLG